MARCRPLNKWCAHLTSVIQGVLDPLWPGQRGNAHREEPCMSVALPGFVIETLIVLTVLFVFIVGIAVLAIVILFILDVAQTKRAIRRNYPVIGRFRYLFEHLGTFFRQYFFAMDREEMPSNRLQRNYVDPAAKETATTISLGSALD